MAFHRITPAELGREDIYRYFMEEAPCTYSMCVDIDVTELRAAAKARGTHFFAAFLYALTKAVNGRREFRMNFDETGALGYYDAVHPCYTVFHEQSQRFSDVWTRFDEDFDVFYRNYLADREAYGGAAQAPAKPYEGGNLFNVSCIPWARFTAFHLHLQKGYRHLPPLFTVGRFAEAGGRTAVPLAVQVHHAVCDGRHVSLLVADVQRFCAELAARLA